MFRNIPKPVLDRMKQLEETDARDRSDGTHRLVRLRQVPPQTGRFIALLAAMAPSGRYVEIGTSAGYSAMWLSLACRLTGRKLTTFEVLPEKVRIAKETFATTGIADVVDLIHGDARDYLSHLSDIAFCFLDAEKEYYAECYDLVVPRLVSGGILVADNAISHADDMRAMLDRAEADERVDSVIVPIGTGDLVCRKL